MQRLIRKNRRTGGRIALLLGLMFMVGAAQGCSKFVYEHKEGRLSRGTFSFLKTVYYQGQFEEEENVAVRNKAIVDDLADLDAAGALASRKGLKEDPYYPEYMYRQEHARHGKAAIWFWQQKYKDKFNWQMLFSAEKLQYDERTVIPRFLQAAGAGDKLVKFQVAEFEGRPVHYGDLRRVMTVSDYEQFPKYSPPALASGLRDVLKAWLEKQIHDRVLKQMSADERELRRFDHNRVAILFLKVRYGKAGKGIYPGSMEKIPLKPVEIYEHFHKMQNTMAEVLWVKAAYTVVAEDTLAEELVAKLEKGGNFEQLAQKYALAPKYAATAKPFTIQGYQKKKNIEDRESRDYYDRLLIDMASRDVKKPDPYLGRDGIVIARIYDVGRTLEKVKLEDVGWKVENDLRTKMLNDVYESDIRDSRAWLKIVYNERLVKTLP